MQLGEIAPIAFRDQDVGGPSQIFGRFAKGSAWQEKLVAKRGLPVDQYNVKTSMESQILQTVVEDQEVASELIGGMACTGNAILVDNHGHAPEILGQHEGFIPGCFGIEQQGTPLRNDTHRGHVAPYSLTPDTLVASAKDGDLATARAKIPGQLFDNRGLSRSSHSEITNADHRAADLMPPENMVSVKTKPRGNDEHVEEGDPMKNRPQNSRPLSGTPFQDDVDGKLFETVEESTHPFF